MLRAHPAFETALSIFTHDTLVYRERTRDLAKLMDNRARFRVLTFVMALAVARREAGAPPAIPQGDIFQLAGIGRGSTVRTLRTSLSLMQFAGLTTVSTDPRDGRAKLHRPTRRLLDLPRLYLAPAARALDAIDPSPARAARLADPAFAQWCFGTAAKEYVEGVPDDAADAGFMTFIADRDGSFPFALALLDAALAERQAPSRSAIAERFSLSKTQITKLVRRGTEAGYVELMADGRADASHRLVKAYAEWVANVLVFLDRYLSRVAP